MERPKLLIADGNDDTPDVLTQLLQDKYEIRCCESGKDALALLRSFRPDLLVLDLMLTELDGISLLQTAAASGLKPNVLVLSSLYNPYVLGLLNRLDIQYAMRKPCDLDATVERIADLIHQTSPHASVADLRPRILSLLHALHFSVKHDGYTYLQEAIVKMAQNPGQSITKELYPAVAAICSCSAGQVERSIRTAIAAAWKATDPQQWIRIFDLDPRTVPKRPTNSEFIVSSLEVLSKF